MLKFKVIVEAMVYPTEDPNLVKRAVENVFDGNIKLEKVKGTNLSKIIGLSDQLSSLTTLKDLIRRERIRAAAHNVLSSSISQSELKFHLNKQVAHVGHVSFCQAERESPLGPITITILGEDLIYAVDWITDYKQVEQA